MLTMDQLMNVILIIDKVHTAPERASDCELRIVKILLKLTLTFDIVTYFQNFIKK